MAKPEEKKKARKYRKQGKSIKWITDKLGVTKDTVSRWTRDIVLTDEQEAILSAENERYEAQKKGAKANEVKARRNRRRYQEEGRAKAREGDRLHHAGCMLYWAEGHKSRVELGFSNSDPQMMGFYMRFIRDSLKVKESKISVTLIFYLNQGYSQEEIEAFWLDILTISASNMNKSSILKQKPDSNQKSGKLPYGMCKVSVSSVKHIQHVYGAIQEYANMDKPEWLD